MWHKINILPQAICHDIEFGGGWRCLSNFLRWCLEANHISSPACKTITLQTTMPPLNTESLDPIPQTLGAQPHIPMPMSMISD